MKAKQLRELSDTDLTSKKTELTTELMKTRTQLAKGANPKLAGLVTRARKTIARINTVMTQRRKGRTE